MSKKVLINCRGRYIGDNLSAYLSTQKVGATASEPEEPETPAETTDEATQPKQFFEVNSLGLEYSRDEILQQSLNSDVIIWNICDFTESSGNDVSDGSWLIEQLAKLSDNFQKSKQFILVSTVATWGRTKPKDIDDPGLAFDDIDFRSRRAHLNFKEHLALEKAVVKAGKGNKSKLSSYVVCSAVQYGAGESVFHYMFKQPWLNVDKEVCVYGNGKNMIPTIHITDLSQIVCNIIDHKPTQKYIVAVDTAFNTYGQIARSIVKSIGNGRVKKIKDTNSIHSEEDITSQMADLLQIGLSFEQSELIKEVFTINWKQEMGMIDNVADVIGEYRASRKLRPVRLAIAGPPQSGKTALSRQLATEYQLHVISAENLVNNTIEQLQEVVSRHEAKDNAEPVEDGEDAEEDEEDEEGDDGEYQQAQDLYQQITDAMEVETRLEDELFCEIFKYQLTSKKCKNQGFILDGFPKTKAQADLLFAVGEDEAEEFGENEVAVASHLPEIVVSLEASDDWLKNRVMSLTEESIQGTHNNEEGFLRRLAKYKENNNEDESPETYFDEHEVHPKIYVLDGNIDPEIVDENYGKEKPRPGEPFADGSFSSILNHIREMIGKPRNYGPTTAELAEINLVNERKRSEKEAAEEAELVRKQNEEEELRKKRMMEWAERLAEVHKQEAEQFQAASLPLRNYLMSYVMPTLTQAIQECNKVRPEDPVDFIAEYLFKHNPQYD